VVEIKSPEEIALMREAGRVVAHALARPPPRPGPRPPGPGFVPKSCPCAPSANVSMRGLPQMTAARSKRVDRL
jgi:hypothetical protein